MPGIWSRFLLLFSGGFKWNHIVNAGDTYQLQQLIAGLGLLSVPLHQQSWDALRKQHRRDLAEAIG